LTFAAAMYFDLKDPQRVTRYSACGFWLHIAAAPALVNTVAVTLLNQGNLSGTLLGSGLAAAYGHCGNYHRPSISANDGSFLYCRCFGMVFRHFRHASFTGVVRDDFYIGRTGHGTRHLVDGNSA
jgi:hypothetical protein